MKPQCHPWYWKYFMSYIQTGSFNYGKQKCLTQSSLEIHHGFGTHGISRWVWASSAPPAGDHDSRPAYAPMRLCATERQRQWSKMPLRRRRCNRTQWMCHSGIGELQRRKGCCGPYWGGGWQEAQPHLALQCGEELRQLQDAWKQTLNLFLPGPSGHSSFQI